MDILRSDEAKSTLTGVFLLRDEKIYGVAREKEKDGRFVRLGQGIV